MVLATATAPRVYRKRPTCRHCGRKIGIAWAAKPSESYRSYDPATNTYVCTPCRYEQRWFDVRCPRCARTGRRRLGQLHRLHQWKNGDVRQDADGVYVYLCWECTAQAPGQRQRAARSANMIRLQTRRLPDAVRHWHRDDLENAVATLLDEIPPALAVRIGDLLPDADIGREGYAIYRAALGRKMTIGRPPPDPAHQSKAARAPHPRQGLRVILRYLLAAQDLIYQCRGCGELTHLRPGHVRRAAERGGKDVGVLCSACWRKYPNHWGVQPIPGWAGWVTSPKQLRGRLVLLLRARLGEMDRALSRDEHNIITRIENRLRASHHPWCRTLVSALDRL